MLRFVTTTLAVALLAACNRSDATHDTAQAAPRVKATVEAVTRIAFGSPYEAVGTVRADMSVVIQSKATGHVTAVHVNEGDSVMRGQVLVELDDREAKAQLAGAQSALQAAREARQEVGRAVEAAVHAKSAAEAGAELAESTYRRYEGLIANKAVSQQSFEEVTAKSRMASAETAKAGEMLASMRAKLGEVEARIQQAEAEVSTAETMLTYTQVAAPFDGRITNKYVDVGDLAAPGGPLLEIETRERYRLEALVDESSLGRVHEGDEIPVILDALGTEPVTGTVAKIVPAADAASRTFIVKIDLPHLPDVNSGLFGRAYFPMGGAESLTVPKTAVVERGQLAFVFVVGEEQVARMRLITIGNTHGDRVEVLSGLEEGERIVTNGLQDMTDGVVVDQA